MQRVGIPAAVHAASKEVHANGGSGGGGRKKLYLKQTKDSLRVYPFADKDTPQAGKEKIAKLLREALEFLGL